MLRLLRCLLSVPLQPSASPWVNSWKRRIHNCSGSRVESVPVWLRVNSQETLVATSAEPWATLNTVNRRFVRETDKQLSMLSLSHTLTQAHVRHTRCVRMSAKAIHMTNEHKCFIMKIKIMITQSFLYNVRMVSTDASEQESQLNLPGQHFVAVRGENHFHSRKNGPT